MTTPPQQPQQPQPPQPMTPEVQQQIAETQQKVANAQQRFFVNEGAGREQIRIDPSERRAYDFDGVHTDIEVMHRQQVYQDRSTKLDAAHRRPVGDGQLGIDPQSELPRGCEAWEGIDPTSGLIRVENPELMNEFLSKEDEASARQRMRRQTALSQSVAKMLTRVPPSGKWVHISLEDYKAFLEGYQEEQTKGTHPNSCEWVPLSYYQAMIKRPLFNNEVGTIQHGAGAGTSTCIKLSGLTD